MQAIDSVVPLNSKSNTKRNSSHRNMVYSTTTLWASVASSAIAGVALGVYLGAIGGESSLFSRVGSAPRRRRVKCPKRLILVRHGESEGNIDPLLYCTVPDNAMHLTALGFQQAVAAGNSIKQMLGDETVRFIVSPYTRTIETFQGLTKAWGEKGNAIPWCEEPRIREQDFGNFQEPLKIRECKAQRRRFGSFFYRFPSGESPADVYDRVSSFLESLYRSFEKTTEENFVLVTHGVAIRVILTRYFKYRICEFEQLENFHNGEFVVLEFNEQQGRYNLGKVVSNKVTVNSDGAVEKVETKEYTALRVYDMEALSSTLVPYPTSPVNHFRRSSSAMFAPAITTSSTTTGSSTAGLLFPRPTASAVSEGSGCSSVIKANTRAGSFSIPEEGEAPETKSLTA